MMRCFLVVSSLLLAACSKPVATDPPAAKAPEPSYFRVDPSTAGAIKGSVAFTGKKPARKSISMEADVECSKLHRNRPVLDTAVVTNSSGGLANVFVYVKSGLEGKTFEVPTAPVTLDQRGCWFEPRVLGIQVGQTFQVTNSDPVTHNVHPQAEVNREWNQSQAGGDPPLSRKFAKAEILIPVKCNIHRWMRAFIGVVDHPYFAVSQEDGKFELRNLPPGDYTIAAVHELFGTQEQRISLAASQSGSLSFSFRGE